VNVIEKLEGWTQDVVFNFFFLKYNFAKFVVKWPKENDVICAYCIEKTISCDFDLKKVDFNHNILWFFYWQHEIYLLLSYMLMKTKE
jgi:hypothetical protein